MSNLIRCVLKIYVALCVVNLSLAYDGPCLEMKAYMRGEEIKTDTTLYYTPGEIINVLCSVPRNNQNMVSLELTAGTGATYGMHKTSDVRSGQTVANITFNVNENDFGTPLSCKCQDNHKTEHEIYATLKSKTDVNSSEIEVVESKNEHNNAVIPGGRAWTVGLFVTGGLVVASCMNRATF